MIIFRQFAQRHARAFAISERGTVATLFGLSFIPMMLMIGAGIDFGRALRTSTVLQAAVDQAALGSAGLSGSARDSQVMNMVNAALAGTGITATSTTAAGQTGSTYNVSFKTDVPTTFMSSVISSIPVTRKSTVVTQAGSTTPTTTGGNVCLMLVSPNATNALSSSGSASLSASGCEIDVKSTAPVAGYWSGSNNWNVNKICVEGGTSISGSYSPGGYNSRGQLVANNITAPCTTFNDTIAGTLPVVTAPTKPSTPTTPTAPTCTAANTNVSFNNGSYSLSDTTYCGTTSFGGSISSLNLTNVTFAGPVSFGGSITTSTITNSTFLSTLSFNGSITTSLNGVTAYGAASLSGSTKSTIASSTFVNNLTFSGSVNQTISDLTVYGALTSSGSNSVSITGTFNPYGSVTLSGSTTMNVPGNTTFYGPVSYAGSQTLNLGSGLYIFEDAVSFSGSSKLTGTGVTLYFANAKATFSGTGSASLTLSAPTSGTYNDILMFEPVGLATSSFTMMGSIGSPYHGLIYLPSRNASFSGASGANSDVLRIVFNTLTMSGSNNWSFQADPNWPLGATTTTTTTAGQLYLAQ